MHLFERAAVKNQAEVINRIPVIDCGPAFRREPGAMARLVKEIEHACREVGFFYVANHGVPQTVIDDGFAASQAFHALPLASKMRLRQDRNNIGYMPMKASVIASDEIHSTKQPNQNASFFVGHDRPADHPDVLANVRLRGRNQWPTDLPGFREKVMAYFQALQGLGERLLPALAGAVGVPSDYFDEAFANEPYIELRLLHSPPQTDVSDEQFNIAPHTDNSFITILARQHEERPSLGVRLKNGEWFKAPILEGTFLINLGNAMRRYSNGEFMSTPHGVINENTRDRYSIAFFYSPNPASTVEPVAPKVTSERPPQFEPVKYGEMVAALHDRNYGQFRPDNQAR
jgi:isopenicillin N synthase-like dioxygenase